MIAFVAWYLTITLLGWLTFPLVYRLFPALVDRGYTLARASGLLLWAYAFWLFTTFRLSYNNVGGILFGLLPLVALSLYALLGSGSQAAEMVKWARRNIVLIITTETLFLVAFALLALLRAGNPTLDNAEKPMELMFINSILRSPTFPPHDGWLSGYAISYYYFGYVMTAMLAKLTGISGSIAHNLMTALIFALAAIGSYGILFDLLAPAGPKAQAAADRVGAAIASFLAPLFLLIVSNIEGFLEVLHRIGFLWTGTHNFWTWLGISELDQAPALPYSLIPDRFWWWWRASRVIYDYDLLGGSREVIDEFPFFSFLHADLHPHVLAIPFILLTIAVALHLFLGGWRRDARLLGLPIRITPSGFLAAALVLGGLAFVNSWDIVLGAALIVLAYGLMCVRLDGWSWDRVLDMLLLAVPLGVTAVLLYLPFYLGFSSQAGGLLPNLVSPTRGAQLWVMWMPLLVPLLWYLAYLWRGKRQPARWRLALIGGLGFILVLWLLSIGVAFTFLWREPDLASSFLHDQGVSSSGALLVASLLRRLSFIGGLLTMLAVFIPTLAFIAALSPQPPAPPELTSAPAARTRNTATYFVLLLILLGSLLLIGPEFVYLRDQFGYRLNTIFKFYFQAWLLWSIPCAYAVVKLVQQRNGLGAVGFLLVLVPVLGISLVYPALSIGNKTNAFKPPLGWTLDDFRRIEQSNPDEAAAIQWLKSAPDGIVAEAVGGSYTEFGRISVYTGLPTVLGWPGHEVQWRGTSAPQGTRADDIKLLYETPDWETAWTILQRYNIRYVYLGGLERSTYAVRDDKFRNHLGLVFETAGVQIYEVP